MISKTALFGRLAILGAHKSEDKRLTAAIEEGQPHGCDVDHIACKRWLCGAFQHPPAYIGIMRKQSPCRYDDHHNQHNNSFLSGFEGLGAYLNRLRDRFDVVLFCVSSATVYPCFDLKDGDNVEAYHKRERNKTQGNCLNNVKSLSSLK